MAGNPAFEAPLHRPVVGLTSKRLLAQRVKQHQHLGVVLTAWRADTTDMNNTLRSIRRAAAVAVAIAAAGVVAGPASAASSGRWHHGTRSTPVTAAATPAPATTAAAAAPSVTSVISIGGYVFYNMTYLEAVDAWFAAVAAAPAGYTPPTVYSVSVDTTVSGTVDEDGNR